MPFERHQSPSEKMLLQSYLGPASDTKVKEDLNPWTKPESKLVGWLKLVIFLSCETRKEAFLCFRGTRNNIPLNPRDFRNQ